jgi:hypothetical protein
MQAAVKDLLSEIIVAETTLNEDVVVSLVTIFEQSNIRNYRNLLSTGQYATIRLSEQEQREVVQRLAQIFINTNFCFSSLLWIMGKASSNAVLDAFLDLIQQHQSALNNQSIYQLLIGLENAISDQENELWKQKLAAETSIAFLENCAFHKDERISEVANRLLLICKL